MVGWLRVLHPVSVWLSAVAPGPPLRQGQAEHVTLAAISPQELAKTMIELEQRMMLAAEGLDFEKAALLRDELSMLKTQERSSKNKSET